MVGSNLEKPRCFNRINREEKNNSGGSMDCQQFFADGFVLKKNILSHTQIHAIQSELLNVAHLVDSGQLFGSLDDCWNFHKLTNRLGAGKIYNAFKHLQSIKKLATSDLLESFLLDECQIRSPALVDVNCRIDSYGEDQYLFDWHQDYWFSVCSTKAVVVWIPITNLTPENGGLELISNKFTNRKIFKTKKNSGSYTSYADAVLLNENVGHYESIKITDMDIGDVLCFSFDVLHKSLPINSTKKSRFTVQLRFADFADIEFFKNDFKPGVVNRDAVDYLVRS